MADLLSTRVAVAHKALDAAIAALRELDGKLADMGMDAPPSLYDETVLPLRNQVTASILHLNMDVRRGLVDINRLIALPLERSHDKGIGYK